MGEVHRRKSRVSGAVPPTILGPLRPPGRLGTEARRGRRHDGPDRARHDARHDARTDAGRPRDPHRGPRVGCRPETSVRTDPRPDPGLALAHARRRPCRGDRPAVGRPRQRRVQRRPDIEHLPQRHQLPEGGRHHLGLHADDLLPERPGQPRPDGVVPGPGVGPDGLPDDPRHDPGRRSAVRQRHDQDRGPGDDLGQRDLLHEHPARWRRPVSVPGPHVHHHR